MPWSGHQRGFIAAMKIYVLFLYVQDVYDNYNYIIIIIIIIAVRSGYPSLGCLIEDRVVGMWGVLWYIRNGEVWRPFLDSKHLWWLFWEERFRKGLFGVWLNEKSRVLIFCVKRDFWLAFCIVELFVSSFSLSGLFFGPDTIWPHLHLLITKTAEYPFPRYRHPSDMHDSSLNLHIQGKKKPDIKFLQMQVQKP